MLNVHFKENLKHRTDRCKPASGAFKKQLLMLTFYVLSVMVLCSCTSEAEKKAGDARNRANALSAQIDKAISAQQYRDAIILVDSLNKEFPEQLELRKTSMLQRARAMEGDIRDSIIVCDALLSLTQFQMDSLKQFLTGIEEKDLPGYVIDKATAKVNLLNGNTLQPRLGDFTSPWVLAVSVKGNIGITSLEVTVNGKTYTASANNPIDRRVSGRGVEMLSFASDELENFSKAFNETADSNLDVKVVGEKGIKTISVNPATATAVHRISLYAELRESHRRALVTRELLERKLIVAQNQLANLETQR